MQQLIYLITKSNKILKCKIDYLSKFLLKSVAILKLHIFIIKKNVFEYRLSRNHCIQIVYGLKKIWGDIQKRCASIKNTRVFLSLYPSSCIVLIMKSFYMNVSWMCVVFVVVILVINGILQGESNRLWKSNVRERWHVDKQGIALNFSRTLHGASLPFRLVHIETPKRNSTYGTNCTEPNRGHVISTKEYRAIFYFLISPP